MKKTVKKVLIIGGGIVVVFLILLSTVPLLFKDRIKETVTNKVNDRLNAELVIKDLGISVFSNFPNITLSLEDMSIVGIGVFDGDTLMKTQSANITFSFWQIFKGNYTVSAIDIDGAEVYAKVLADGSANWDIMKSDSVSVDRPVINNVNTDNSRFKLQPQKILLNNSKLVYEDQALDLKVLLSDWSGEVSGNFTAKKTTLKTESTIGEISFMMRGFPFLSKIRCQADATVDVDMDKIKLTFVESNIQLNNLKAAIDGTFALVGKNGKDFDLKLKAPDIQFKDILSIVPVIYNRDFKDLKTEGTVSLEGYIKGIMQGEKYPAFDFKMLVRNAMLKYPSLPKSVDNINVAMDINSKGGNLDNLIVDVSKFDFTIGGNPFSVNINVQTTINDANLKAKAKGVIDLSMIKEVYPLEKGTDLNGKLSADLNISTRMSAIEKEQYENVEVNGSFRVNNVKYKCGDNQSVLISNAALEFSPRYVNLSSLYIKIGKNEMSANGRLENFIGYLLKNKALKGQLRLKSSYFNINDFRETESKVSSEKNVLPIDGISDQAHARSGTLSSDGFIIPRNIDFTLDADMKHVVYEKTNLTNLKGIITIKDGIAKMQNVSANALGGVVKISGVYDTADNQSAPKIDLILDINKASFVETFKSLETIQEFDKIEGNYSMNISLKATMGANVSQMLGTLSATGLIQSKEVKVQNVEMLDELASSLKSSSLKSITAKDLRIPFSISNGEIETKSFSINIGEGGKLNLEGIIGVDQTINYKGGVVLPKNKGFVNAIPLTITGTFSAPKISVDTKSMINDIAGQLLGGNKGEK